MQPGVQTRYTHSAWWLLVVLSAGALGSTETADRLKVLGREHGRAEGFTRVLSATPAATLLWLRTGCQVTREHWRCSRRRGPGKGSGVPGHGRPRARRKLTFQVFAHHSAASQPVHPVRRAVESRQCPPLKSSTRELRQPDHIAQLQQPTPARSPSGSPGAGHCLGGCLWFLFPNCNFCATARAPAGSCPPPSSAAIWETNRGGAGWASAGAGGPGGSGWLAGRALGC